MTPNTASIEALLGAGRYRDAEAACDAILRGAPRDPQARFYRAWAGVGLAKLDESRAVLLELLRERPDIVAARYLLADIDRMARRPEAALARYGEALALEFALPPAADPPARLESLLEHVARSPSPAWTQRLAAMQAFGVAYATSQPPLPAEALARIAASPLPLAPEEEFNTRFAGAAALLACDPQMPGAWMASVFDGVLLPWMQRALEAGRFDNGLTLEHAIYATYVKQTENERHFGDAFARWKDDMVAAGRRFAATLPAVARKPDGPRPRVAFFVHNLTMLAHVKTLLEVMEGHAELTQPLVDAWVFYISGQPEVAQRFARAGVKAEPLLAAGRATRFTVALAALRSRIAEEGIGTVAWISLALEMPFAFGMRLAPRQVWWAMKYHALEFDGIDGYVTGGSQVGGTKAIHGRTWSVGPVAASDWYAPEKAAAARQVREGLGARGVVYGSFGREEKLNSPAFVDAVARILREQPDAMFLWTGRAQLAAIQERLDAAGVAARCRFIGWVDTKLYAQVIDVFLDSFPFPCGFTLYEAMAAGKPVVLYDSPESTNGGINAMVAPLLRAQPPASEHERLAQAIFGAAGPDRLYLRARTPDEYVAMALRLARDAAFRERAGEAARQFIERLMSDRQDAARIYLAHVTGKAA